MPLRPLYPHQDKALQHLQAGASGALFMRMRLGKTLVIIRWIAYLQKRAGRRLSVLVVAPMSALDAWEKELRLEGGHRITWLLGTAAQRRVTLATASVGYCLINKEGFLALPEIANYAWDVVVVDESTFLKNPKSKVSRFFCRHFRDVPHRAILTGVPNPEGTLDFFQQMKFLYGNMIGADNYWAFRSRLFRPGGYGGYEWTPNPGTDELITKWVSENAFVLSLEDAGIYVEKVYEQRYLTLPPRTRQSYERAEEEFVLALDGEVLDRTKWLLKKYTWLRRMCGGWIGETHLWKGKQRELRDLLLSELSDEQVVVWFVFNKELLSARKALQDVGVSCAAYLGRKHMSLKQRNVAYHSFQQGEVRVLLLQVSCASFSLDLSAASTAIYFSSPLSRELRTQSEDRILSLQKPGPLLIVDLLVDHSVDEDIFTLLENKEARGSVFLDACRRLQARVR